MKRFHLLVVCVFGFRLVAVSQEMTLESRRLHLGRPGQYEWDVFKDRPVDAERLEIRFEARSNTHEHTLRIWQRDVKLGWPVLLNNRKLGALVTAETPQECVLAVPAGAVRDGENVLVVEAPASLDDIEVGPVILTAKPVTETIGGARIEVTVTALPNGETSPCRITLTRADGTLQPLFAEPAGAVAARTGVVYSKNGHASISVPPGDYVVHAGRGFEWSVAKQAVSLKVGDTKEMRMELRREVDTSGWIAADSHIHTLTFSGHGDAKIEERMLTIAGEGIELAISTDHNHHTDYAPMAASMGVADRFTPVIGNEVTTKHGHFNAFPIQPGAKVVDVAEDDWAILLPAIRATPGVKVITLNHPRDLHSGFVPLGGVQFNPKTGKHRQADALDVDAMEVVTSAAMQSDIHLLYRDWFALLNRGHRISAVGSSDSHDVNRFILGQGRTYVAVDDADPSHLNLDEIWHSYREGRLLVSLGLLTTMTVDGRFTVGHLATGLGEKIKVEIIVSGPSWVTADHVELFANGILVREQALSDEHHAGEKARVAWELPRPAHDVHLVAIATGPGVTEPFWEIPRPYQATSKTFTPRVIGSTNPVWIDADGDGQFQSACAIAQSLLKRFGKDREKLGEALKSHDESVAIQVAALIGE
ncbi:CehA/McbA family metallohydrolase [Prosthecobacter sp.]|uniref:CehA/McbA family metallohydrolase n=1 Tax=Prosthecobacter sp. TaxID=1965333 RepID=UPI001D6E9614|nr:CehA/McbA family metallohydrolase [Prosthecobacter sp.]MCB1276265.1 PHP domain-containing protein [Prosthecobacter sp.]